MNQSMVVMILRNFFSTSCSFVTPTLVHKSSSSRIHIIFKPKVSTATSSFEVHHHIANDQTGRCIVDDLENNDIIDFHQTSSLNRIVIVDVHTFDLYILPTVVFVLSFIFREYLRQCLFFQQCC